MWGPFTYKEEAGLKPWPEWGGGEGQRCSQLMNQTEAMVMEKKGPGLMSTLTNAAVRAKSSRMTSRLPRIRTISGMLLTRRGREGMGWAPARQGGGRQETEARAGQGELRGTCRGSGGRMGALSQAQMELPELGSGEGPQRVACAEPEGRGLSPLVQEGVEEGEEQQGQLGQ